jgi:hypothetical protein
MAEKKLDPKLEAALEMGELIGQTKAYTRVAGRCTAAKAMALAAVHDQKAYRILGLDWEGFCYQKIGMNRRLADQIIAEVKEFGPVYFDLAQLTPINARQYRQIAPSVNEQGLTYAGETISFTEKNAPRLTAAIADLRKQAESTADKTVEAGVEEELAKEAAQAERALEEAVKRLRHVNTLPLTRDMRSRIRMQMDFAMNALRTVQYEIIR